MLPSSLRSTTNPTVVTIATISRSVASGVDVNSEVPERSMKNFEMTFLIEFLVSSTAKY